MKINSTDLTEQGVSRRAFAKAGLTGLSASIVAAAAASIAHPEVLFAQTDVTDIDILQFAMNLEWLEAEFYTVATTGRTLDQSGFTVTGEGRQGTTTGGAKVVLTGSVQIAADALTRDEQAHVKVLQAALGNHAIAKPSINLNALGIGFNNQNEFLTLSRAFEDVGVSAYGGAAPLIQNKDILATAARIALTEAQHAGAIRLLVSQTNGLSVPPVDGNDVPPLGSPNGTLFQVDGNGLSIVRTPSQVLNIVLAGASERGGFFPDGFNGSGPIRRA
jgi:hypothetical protein